MSLFVEHVGRGLELVADSLEHPSFPVDRPGADSRQPLDGAGAAAGQPGAACAAGGRAEFVRPTNPYGYDALGTAASLHAITRDEIAAFHASHYGPKGTLLELTGDVTPTEARKLAEEYFGKWTASGGTVEAPTAPAAPERKILVVDKPGSPQTALLTFGVGMPRNSADYPATTVMNTMLGGLFLVAHQHEFARRAWVYVWGAVVLLYYAARGRLLPTHWCVRM